MYEGAIFGYLASCHLSTGMSPTSCYSPPQRNPPVNATITITTFLPLPLTDSNRD